MRLAGARREILIPFKEPSSVRQISNFIRATGAQWLAPLLLLALLLQAAPLAFILQGEHTPGAVAMAGFGIAGLLLVAGLALALARRTLHIEEARQESETALLCLREAIDEMPAGFELYDPHDRLMVCNLQMERMYPQSHRAQSLGLSYESLLRRALQEGTLVDAPAGQEDEWIQRRMATRGTSSTPLLRRLSSGDWVHLYESRTVSGCIVAVRVNVTEAVRQREVLHAAQTKAHAAEVRLREAIEAMPTGVAIYDDQDRLVMYNRNVSDMAPYRGGELVGQTYETLIRRSLARGEVVDAMGREDEWLRQRLAGRGRLKEPLLHRLDDGRWMRFHETRTPTGCLIMVRLDVTDLVEKSVQLEQANEQLARLSTTDSLTGLANRRLFDQSLQNEWQRSARSQQPISLLMIDIDYFKRYNDHYGHLTGDACLRQVARILYDCAQRSGELVARYGGEEFALLLPGADAQAARIVAQRCMDEIERARIPHVSSPVSAWLTVSIGVVTTVADANLLPENLVRCADAALYRTKGSGRAHFEVVTQLLD